MFDAVKRKYSDISFQQFNVDDANTASLSSQYGVKGIPHMVFLDGSNNVLMSQSGAPSDEESFINEINQYR